MKKIIIINLALSLLFFHVLKAGNVDTTQAKVVATNFYLTKVISKQKQASLKKVEMKLVYVSKGFISNSNEEPLYYIFNLINDTGFIIIAADDDVIPVLGYSTESNYSAYNQSPAFMDWMKGYKKQILFVKKNKLKATNNIKNEWQNYARLHKSVEITKEIQPLLSVTWNQGRYYNDSCPADTAGPAGHTYTGCVATAMAQIMKYWNYPKQGLGSHSYTHPVYGKLKANFGATTYHWDAMPNILFKSNAAVAQLMYHCGVSLNMNYGIDGSSTAWEPMAPIFINYFSYSPTITIIHRNHIPDTVYCNILKSELDSLRPVSYTGGTHAFVCDGYQNVNYFHFNWGWNGGGNGYYYLNDLRIHGLDFNFTSNQRAMIGIKPYPVPLINWPIVQLNTGGISNDCILWGDYDNDDDLDILIIGKDSSIIYRNDGNNQFTRLSIGIAGLGHSSVAFGDYDNDGDLDILINSYGEYSNQMYTKIYRNDGGNRFVDINANLISVGAGSVAWGDYDNDGDLDVLCSGAQRINDSLVVYTKIYRNDGNDKFKDINADLHGVAGGSVAWGDYDNDGDLDILLTGAYQNFDKNGISSISKIYRNNGDGSFTDIKVNLVGSYFSTASWGDYDNDGYLDILLSGLREYLKDSIIKQERISKIYRNIGNDKFADKNVSLTGLVSSTGGWGDYDNDGDLDIFSNNYNMTGLSLNGIWRNKNGGSFSFSRMDTVNYQTNDAEWGDGDNDGDLDILATGGGQTFIYKNESSAHNAPPKPPNHLRSTIDTNSNVILFWDKSTDKETPQKGLTYNIFIGTSPDSGNILSPMSDIKTGYRRIPKMGNTNLDSTWKIRNFKPGKYYWSVQAIDNGFAGSRFATIDSFYILPISTFTLPKISCLNDNDTIFYTGNATSSAIYNWDFDGGTIVSDSGQLPIVVRWTKSGNKNVRLYISARGALSDTTTTQILINALPNVNLGNDTTIFNTDSIVLNAGNDFIKYLWNDSSTSQTLLVSGSILDTTSYTYWVIVTDSNSCQNADTIIIRITEDNTYVLSPNAGSDIKIYPNPTTGALYFDIDNNKNKTEIQIISNDGKILLSKKYNLNTRTKDRINISSFKSGIYIIKIISGKNIRIKKIILYKL